MERQLKRSMQRFLGRVLPFCLGLLLVLVQLGPAIMIRPILAQAPPSSVEREPEPVADDPRPTTASEPLTSEPLTLEQQRFNQLLEADQLYQDGAVGAAAVIYRRFKPSFDHRRTDLLLPSPAVTDIAQMPPAAKVYWREAVAGMQVKSESRTLVPLKLLVQEYPEFIPGHIQLAQAYTDYAQSNQALAVLQAATSRYPDNPELLKRRVIALAAAEQWMEASIAARQFALLNPDHPEAKVLEQLADEHLQRYRKQLRRKLTGNVLGNVITGALGYVFTGSLFGPINSLQTSFVLLRGESALGDRIARQAKAALPIVTDAAINQYIYDIGMKLAAAAGREDFQYEFVVVRDEDLNAFALPGGKVFINAGAIAKTNSEAELAGLLGHEIAHAVLAHGLQLLTQSSLTANLTQFIPYVGGIAESAITFSYSREMEYQADAFGTRLLAAADYAADGIWNLLRVLQQEQAAQDRVRPPKWLSTHPGGDARLSKVEQLITQVGYNRYAYEGVGRHAAMQQQIARLLQTEAEQNLDDRDQPQPEPTPIETSAPVPEAVLESSPSTLPTVVPVSSPSPNVIDTQFSTGRPSPTIDIQRK